MRRFSEICVDYGYNQFATSPEKIIKWYGYSKGKSLGVFNTSKEATDAGATTFEKFVENEDEIKNFKTNNRDLGNKVFDQWKWELFADNKSVIESAIRRFNRDDLVIESIMDKLYYTAYDRGHSSGYDEVSDYFESECIKFSELMDLIP